MSIDLALSGVLDEVQSLLLERHKKYGEKNVTGSPGGPLNGLRVRLYDKLARINHALDSGGQVDFDDDSFRDAFIDTAGYALIGLLVLDGKWPGAAPAEKPLEDYVERSPDGVLTRRWSSLYHPKEPHEGADAWAVGTTFEPSDGNYVWRRGRDRWYSDDSKYTYENLRTVVDFYAYSDGIITTPAPEEEAA